MAPKEKVIPIAYDGEFYLPLGVGCFRNGRTEIRLERLPEPEPGERSMKSAFQIYFQKVASEKLGFKFSYPQLAVAKINASGKLPCGKTTFTLYTVFSMTKFSRKF